MGESKPVDIDRDKRVKLQPGPPVEAAAPSQMGATFAERAAAASKAVKADDADQGVEDKAVKKAATKTPKKKS